jgi:hypothetical protein
VSTRHSKVIQQVGALGPPHRIGQDYVETIAGLLESQDPHESEAPQG